MKKCATCNEIKSLDSFGKLTSSKDGLKYSCKFCIKEYRKKNKDKIKIKDKNYYENNKNKESFKKSRSNYYENNKDSIINYHKKYREDNKDIIALKNKKYREKNKEILNKKSYEKRIYKINNDLSFKLKCTISKHIYMFLRKKGCTKGGSTFKHLPYTPEELKQHIESQFEPWMSWENWGVYKSSEWDDEDPTTWKWHIDHIIPHSSFNYTSMEDELFKECWALNNLRPYSAKQNVLDGAR